MNYPQGDKNIVKFKNEFGLNNIWTYIGNRVVSVDIEYPRTHKNQIPMSKKQQIFNTIKDIFQEFEKEHSGTTKSSSRNARKVIAKLKPLITEYRKVSVEEDKKPS